jgi:Leucine-rich repeat (LRR) protein
MNILENMVFHELKSWIFFIFWFLKRSNILIAFFFSLPNLNNTTFTFVHRLINERIKSDRIKDILQENGSNTNQIIEVELDNKITEINYHYIQKVDPMAFFNLTNLITLDLSDNLLGSDKVELNSNLLNSCSNLKLIDLSHNQLKSIHSNFFNGLSNLSEVKISK